jgi:hypothetical protein
MPLSGINEPLYSKTSGFTFAIEVAKECQ